MPMEQFNYLFTPIRVGTLTLKNRIVMPPMERNWATRDGAVTDRYLAHYEECARGGPGLIVVEATFVDPVGRGRLNQLGIYKDELVPGLRQLVDAVHRHGVPISIEIHHAGRQTSSAVTGSQPVSASPVPCPQAGNEVPREMTVQEIRQVVHRYAEGARRAKEAGFDAVEVHGAHGYLPLQFLSPWANRRTDEYGGSPENRMRFPLEIVAAIQEKVGPDFTLGYRFSADEFMEGGLTLDDTTLFAQSLEKNGVNYLHVTGGIYENFEIISAPMGVPLGAFVPLASGIKGVVKIPVLAVNRIKDPIQAEKILADGHADLISIGRGMLADPQLPRKAREGRVDDIVLCISCNEGCNARLGEQLDVTCVMNPAVGREREFALKPAAVRKRVMVVGGGPAGMEAARVAAMRGHDVTLYEKEVELGGQVRLASVPPTREELGDLTRNLVHQLEMLGVRIKLGTAVTPELVAQKAPDALVLATGAKPKTLHVAGADRLFVVSAWDVLERKVPVGQNVVVIGGDRVGAETAEYLLDQGKTVHLVEESSAIAYDMEVSCRLLYHKRIQTYDRFKAHTGRAVREIADDGVVIDRTRCFGPMEEVKLAPVDTVVVSAGRVSNDDLTKMLVGFKGEVHSVGDCVEPRTALEAIYEGSVIGRKV
jgi:2,4-dienoyl-CoA reductase-like NADH-dependent reductase (Old Yellow Enzyme family)/thioredoxin reductase